MIVKHRDQMVAEGFIMLMWKYGVINKRIADKAYEEIWIESESDTQ